MGNKTLNRYFLVCITLLSSLTTTILQADQPKRPNIILVVTDDQRWDALGCAGNSIIQTPHIDALANNGVLFNNMFCTTSICATSRATIMTGQWERRHRIDAFRIPLTEEQFATTFPRLLRNSGYYTGMVGKWGMGGPLPKKEYDHFQGYSGQGLYYPKDHLDEPGHHLTAKIASQAVNFLKKTPSDKPFLLQVYTKAAHCQDGAPKQFQPDPKYKHLYEDVTIPSPATAKESYFENLPDFLQISEARRRWHLRFSKPEQYQNSVKDYYRLIAGVDDLVGSMVDQLKEKNLFDNTVIIFTSDNGFYLGERGLAGKWFMHEESIRLPLVIYDPRIATEHRNQKRNEIALTTDIAPTIIDLAGLDIPANIQGKSLAGLYQNKTDNWREEFFYEHRFSHPRIPTTEGVRSNRWKYTRYTSIEPIYEELFDLKNDPQEVNNLAGDPSHKDQLALLRERWKTLSKQHE